MRTLARRFIWILGVIFILLIILSIAGSTYEALARRTALSRHSAPGHLVDIGGHQLHIVCVGQDDPLTPVVVLEAGVGAWSIHWHDV
jgi:hypothetical protein